MKTIFDTKVREELIARANRLTPQSPRRFGTMTPDQSLHHINLMLKTSLGESPVQFNGKTALAAIMRLFFFSPLPIPPGKAKAPEPLTATGHYDIEREKAEYRDILNKIAAKSGETNWPANPIFGNLTREQHGKYAWKESDHHLKQFGV